MKSKPAILCRSRSPEPCIGSGDCPRRETHNTEPAPPSNRKSGSLKGARAANSRTHTRESPDFTVNVAKGTDTADKCPSYKGAGQLLSSLVLPTNRKLNPRANKNLCEQAWKKGGGVVARMLCCSSPSSSQARRQAGGKETPSPKRAAPLVVGRRPATGGEARPCPRTARGRGCPCSPGGPGTAPALPAPPQAVGPAGLAPGSGQEHGQARCCHACPWQGRGHERAQPAAVSEAMRAWTGTGADPAARAVCARPGAREPPCPGVVRVDQRAAPGWGLRVGTGVGATPPTSPSLGGGRTYGDPALGARP